MLLDTLVCYGDHSKTLVGGVTESTDVVYDCPSCVQAQLCPQGTNLCFILTARNVYFFQDGYASQPSVLLPEDCQPLRIIEVDPGYEYSVQCASTPLLYNPRRQHIFRPDEESYFNTDGGIIEETGVQTFAKFPDNNLLLDSSLYVVAFLAKSDTVLVLYDAHYPVPIPECSVITKLTAGPVIGNQLQLVVDCIATNEAFARKRVLIADNFRSPPSVEDLPGTHLLNDVVSFSPDGRYILSVSVSQLTITQVSDPNDPGILTYNGPIAQAVFMTNTLLLVSVPGEYREIIDIPKFFSTSFEEVSYVLPESEAVCPQGECPPAVYSNGTLFLFTADHSYQLLSAYDVNNPSASPKRINRVLRTAMYDACYPVTADISVLDPLTPSPPTPPPTASVIDGIEPSRKPLFNEVVGIVGFVICGIVIAIVASIIIAILIFCHWKKRNSKRSTQCSESNTSIASSLGHSK